MSWVVDSAAPRSHHSLVTPIDWKRDGFTINPDVIPLGHHSLVTPIDWKPAVYPALVDNNLINSHHSLVTPIDWKPSSAPLVIIKSEKRHHSLVTPID